LRTLLIIVGFSAEAQFVQDTSKKVQYLVVPVLFKTPELGFGYGLSGSASFKTSNKKDSLTRTSVIQTIGFLTTRKQNVQAIDALIYFPKERYILFFQSSHNYFPDKFWGIGPKTKDSYEEKYIYEHFYFKPHLRRRIFNRVFVGVLFEYQHLFRVKFLENGLFDNSDFYGKKKHSVSGPGCSIGFDSRNNSFWPDKGIFFLGQLTRFNKQFGSDFNVTKYNFDLRWFKKIVKGHIFAVQLLGYLTNGQTPLRELASLGGPNNLRGFYQGRYRANNMYTIIGEYRLQLYKRFSACLFFGTGSVYNRKTEILATNLKYSYGGGLRFALLEKEKLHMRLDYGYSNKYNRGVYFTVGECF
jgi:hypothetical protein